MVIIFTDSIYSQGNPEDQSGPWTPLQNKNSTLQTSPLEHYEHML